MKAAKAPSRAAKTPSRAATPPARRSLAKRGYHHGNLRSALLDAALAQIATAGAYGLSLREVARRAGVSHSASYRHFPSKDELLAAIAEEGFVKLRDAMTAAVRAHAADPLRALQASGVAYVEFGVQHPHHLQLMFGGLIDGDEHPALKEAAAGAYEVLREAVRKAQRTGQIRAGGERIVALAAWAQVHGLAQLIVGGQIDAEGGQPSMARHLATEVTRLLQQGLSAVRTG